MSLRRSSADRGTTGSPTTGLGRRQFLVAAGVPALTAAMGLGSIATATLSPAFAASSVGGSITRDEVLERAKYWTDRQVPYSQAANYPDPQGRNYRTDCSGFVSMAWHLAASENTRSLPNTNLTTRLSSYDDLLPGDILNTSGEHVMIFRAWADKAHSVMLVAEEPSSGRYAINTQINRGYFTSNGFVPLRYKNITGSNSSAPKEGSVFLNSLSGSTWSGARVIDNGGAISQVSATGLLNATLHVDTLSRGSVYGNDLNSTGTSTSAGGEDTGGSVNQVVVLTRGDGVLRVFTLTNGSVYDRQRDASGRWSGFTLVDGNGTIAQIAATGLSDGSIHLQTLVDSKVWDNTWRNGSWSGARIVDQGGAVGSITSAGTSGAALHLFTVSYGYVFEQIISASGSTTGAIKIDNGGNVSRAAATTLPNGTLHLATLSNGSVYDRALPPGGNWNSPSTVDASTKILDLALTSTTDGRLHLLTVS